MNNEKRPGDDGRIYITQGPPPKRKAPPEGSEAAVPRKTHERTLNMVLLLSFVLFGAVLLTFIAVFALSSKGSYAMPPDTKDAPGSDIGVVADPDTAPSAVTDAAPLTSAAPAVTEAPPKIRPITGINSEYAVLIDADTGYVLASRNGDSQMYPASLTKIMTLIVARERIPDLSTSVTFTRRMLYSLELDAMKVGFTIGETVSAIDLMYGAMLPSGCDATVGLAYLCADSEEAFAALMNEKAAQLGLRSTHFTNSSGLYDKDNYSTANEMGIIFAYALKDELMREIICADSYVIEGNGTDSSTRHKLTDRLRLNINEYSAAYGSVKLSGFTMLGGKTGYVDESGSCLASYAVSDSGKHYIIVTGHARNMSEVLSDHYNILMKYATD